MPSGKRLRNSSYSVGFVLVLIAFQAAISTTSGDEGGGTGGGIGGAATAALRKKNSPRKDELIHGVCLLPDARATPSIVPLETSSSFSPGSRIAFSSSVVYRPFSPSPSAAVSPGAVA